MSWFSRLDKVAEQAGDALAAQFANEYPEYDGAALTRAKLAAGRSAALSYGYMERTTRR